MLSMRRNGPHKIKSCDELVMLNGNAYGNQNCREGGVARGGNSSRPTGSFRSPRPPPQPDPVGHFYFGSNRTFLIWIDNNQDSS
jgi:hypothetical protein